MTREEIQKKFGIIGRSKEIRDLVDIITQVSPSDISVLLYGESGVGKEVFARAIHGLSSRKDTQLVSVNCGAIPEGILESELFGHKKGSFTGAFEGRKGYFEIADGGTLLLDEIAEMSLMTQVKLLRVLETKEFMRIGAETVTKVDVRIIAATNKDLQKEVDAKRFREDLYFRLKAVTLNIPPLRKRKEDIELLVNHFLKVFSESNKAGNYTITNPAMDYLINYSWPGNIRELKNVIETAVTLSNKTELDLSSFSFLEADRKDETFQRMLPVHLKKTPEDVDREFIYRALFELKKDIMELKDLVLKNRNEIILNEQKTKIDEVIPLNKLEKEAIVNALRFTKDSKRNAAKLLNISERTLYRKIKEYDL